MINQERKKFALAQGRKPGKSKTPKLLANTALIHAPNETGYCYIAFSQDFVDFVAKEMPRGLAPFDPAFIRVTHLNGFWHVDAVYVNDGTCEILWRQEAMPQWVGKLRKEKSDECDTATETN